MLFFAGIFFLATGLFLLIRLIIISARPKLKVKVLSIEQKKLATDMFGMGPNHPHAKFSYEVNGTAYEGEVHLFKNSKETVGDEITITYKSSDPKTIRFHEPKKDWLMVTIFLLMGGILVGISTLVMNLRG